MERPGEDQPVLPGGHWPAASLPERIILSAAIGLDRASYLALNRAMISLLEDESHTLTVRLLAAHALVAYAVVEYGRGSKATSAFSVWLDHMMSSGGLRWLYGEVSSGREPKMQRRRRVLAALISAMEARYGAPVGRSKAQGAGGGFLTIARAGGTFYSPLLGAVVPLAEMKKVAVNHDLPELRPLMAGYMIEVLEAGALLHYPNLMRGTQFLLIRFALVEWYAAAMATLKGRQSLEIEDVQGAISLVRERYGDGAIADLLRERRRRAALISLLLDMTCAPIDLVAVYPFRSYDQAG